MFQKLLLKSALLRKIFRAIVPVQTAGGLVNKYTNEFDALAAEQAANAGDIRLKEQKLALQRAAAEEEQAYAEKASRNVRKMLEAD